MSNDQDMPRVVFDQDTEQMKIAKSYAKYLEAKNFIRSIRARHLLIRKRIISAVCWSLAVGAYAFTIMRVKQETFLDDFDSPERETKN